MWLPTNGKPWKPFWIKYKDKKGTVYILITSEIGWEYLVANCGINEMRLFDAALIDDKEKYPTFEVNRKTLLVWANENY